MIVKKVKYFLIVNLEEAYLYVLPLASISEYITQSSWNDSQTNLPRLPLVPSDYTKGFSRSCLTVGEYSTVDSQCETLDGTLHL